MKNDIEAGRDRAMHSGLAGLVEREDLPCCAVP